jgi:hypothetical protein
MTRDVLSYLTDRHSATEGTAETLEARVTLSAVW